MALNERQTKFCELYAKTGNASKSYREAGYDVKSEAGARASSSKLLTNPNIVAFLSELEKNMRSEAIADITEVREVWTSILRSKEEETPHRIKAGELLVKAAGGFIEKREEKIDAVHTLVEIVEDRGH